MALNLDLKDREILYELDLDSRRPISGIAKKLRLSKQVVGYRIKKLVKEGIISRFQAVVDTYKLGFMKYKVYISLENANKQVTSELIEYLKNNEKTEWVATCSGKYDIIVGYVVKEIYEFDEAIKELNNKFGQYIEKKEIAVSLGVPHWRKEYLLDNPKYADVVFQGGKQGIKKIDEVDEKIIKLLVNNANLPTVEIAKKLNLNPRVITYRLRKLKKDKIILFYKITLDLNKFDWIYCKAIIKFKNLTYKKYSEFFNYCNTLPNLTYLINCIGGWDVELDFEIENFNKFHEAMLMIRDKFSEIIKSYDFVITLNEDKLGYYPGCLPPLGLTDKKV